MPIGFRSRFFFDAYEEQERILCAKHLKASDVILELGACLGVVSCACNRLLGDKKKHIVVEANPTLIPWLEKNRSVNQADFIIEHGLLSKSSDGSFRIEKFIVSGSANTTTGKLIHVPVLTLDDVCKKHEIIPSAIVMDIEGGELGFLSENQDWIRDHHQLKTMIIEMHPFILSEEEIKETKDILRNSGFSLTERIDIVEVWKR